MHAATCTLSRRRAGSATRNGSRGVDLRPTASTTFHRLAECGFTLIEVLVTCTIIGVLAGITVPTYIARRISANEGAVVATLRAVSQAQFQFRAQNSVDTNRDGGSEYGSLGELAAVDPLRGLSEPLSQRLLSSTLGTLDNNGHAILHGYRLALYLPDASGAGVLATLANRSQFDALGARDYYTCLAWPISVDVTGHRTYFLNQQGQVLKTLANPYSGLASIPPAGAGLQGTSGPGQINSQFLAANATGADGRAWAPVH
ncbi:MAG: prepilin-type N-terminal cleavage/methylation domain-containing protein [Planctomycetota bacterium]